VPADVLPDLAALQEMLVELAKAEYLSEHPERSRAPRNFDTIVQVHLAGIEEGSAKLNLVLFFAGLFTPYQSAFESAQQAITQAVSAVSQGQQPSLSPRYLAYFERVGRGLREGESLDFPISDGYAVLNQETRRGLIRASQVEEWTERESIRARVSMTDYRADKYEVQLPDGTVVPGELSPTIKEQLADAHRAFGTGKNEWLILQCVVRRDHSDKIKSIESVEHAALLDPLDVPIRLQELAKLKDGWFDGEGKPLPEQGLAWFSGSFAANFDSELSLPYLYPTPEGMLRAEWTIRDWEISMDVNLNTKSVEYQALQTSSEECDEFSISLADDEGWQRLNSALQRLESAETGVTSA